MSQQEKKKMGFRDKIKKMLESDSSPKSSNKKANEALINENSVSFTLTGGPVHSELLFAEAQMKADVADDFSMPLPIVCKWFNRNNVEEVSEIEGVTGAFYQPNADDVHTSIIVEAIPILEGREYKGAPLRKEVGPLSLDKKIQNDAQEILNTGWYKTEVSVDSLNDSSLSVEQNNEINERISFPITCTLSMTMQQLELAFSNEAASADSGFDLSRVCELGTLYPTIKIVKKSNNLFDLFVSPTLSYRIIATSNTQRDLITVGLRLFAGKKLVEGKSNNKPEEVHHQVQKQQQRASSQNGSSQVKAGDTEKDEENSPEEVSPLKKVQMMQQLQQQQSQESFEVFVVINELKKKTVELEEQREVMKKDLDTALQYKAKAEQLELEVSRLNESLEKEHATVESWQQKHKAQLDENLFLNSEISALQGEREQLEKEIEEMREAMNEISLPNDQIVKHQDEVEALKKSLLEAEEVISELRKRNEELVKEQEVLKEAVDENLNGEKDALTNEVNHWKKKYETLLQESSRPQVIQQVPLPKPKEEMSESKSISRSDIDLEEKEEDDVQMPAPIQLLKIQSCNGIMSARDSQQQLPPTNVLSSNSYQDMAVLKDQISIKIQENNELNRKVHQLETALDTVSRAYTQDVKAINSPTKWKAKEGGNEFTLRKLINSLTEMITDKDIALDDLRRINRELNKRVEEQQQAATALLQKN